MISVHIANHFMSGQMSEIPMCLDQSESTVYIMLYGGEEGGCA